MSKIRSQDIRWLCTAQSRSDRLGVAGRAVYVSTGNYLSVEPTSASVSFNGEVTISFWANVLTNTNCMRYFQCGGSFSTTNFVDVGSCGGSGGQDLFWGLATGYTYLWGSLAPITNQWVHRAVIVQNTGSTYTVTIYENLASVGSTTQNAQYLASNNLGSCNFGLSWYGEQANLYYDDIAFWRRALSYAELTTVKGLNFWFRINKTFTSVLLSFF